MWDSDKCGAMEFGQPRAAFKTALDMTTGLVVRLFSENGNKPFDAIDVVTQWCLDSG